ncbi:hypothetical protein EG68_10119 [Paragonimus skrjabini miyazakii]|uniref:ATP-grasp domain-containing protein n=1 Tax=Paragonimus skrjabini miyazakii TaxID=59628 RepID=A0A8S9YD46_9TREM|nr:hypothetical protein EG68_10119 [Paragonimus skrjabini miyazakii]
MDSDTFFPRCFILSEDEDKQAFIEEFRLTACMSLLKLTCSVFDQVTESPKCPLPTDGQKESGFGSARTSASSFLSTDNTFTKMTPRSTFSTPNHPGSDCSDGFELPGTRAFQIPPWSAQNPLEKIPHSVIDMAIARCQYFIRSKFHWDIDQPLSNLSDKSWPWDNFLTWHYIACKNPKILDGLNEYVEVCQSLCGKLSKLCPQFSLDGTYNVWIVKPGAKSRGRGIICCNQLEDLLRIMQSSISFGECRFVVQKYIERPLLVHKTKFDIRQWFLVTDWSPLTVWWYRDCYLRFCSQEFTLDDFSEAIHLSNNSIQHKYENGTRSERLPQENMWTLEEFQQWLLEEGHGETWGKHIEPSMKRAIISTLLCAQEVVEPRKNSFALYGADFILTDDFHLWLIEINASPCMAPSTSVTAKLTSNVLEDTLKVVLDRRSERNCDVGRFELIYRQIIAPPAIYTGLDLRVEGTQVPAAPVEVRGISRQPWIPVTFETAHKRTTLAPIVKLRAKFKAVQQQDEPDELKTTSIRPMATTTVVCSPLPGIEVKAEELKTDEERSITSKESRRLVETNHDKELNSSSTEVKLCAETLQTIVSVRSAALATEANQPSVGVDCSKRNQILQKTNPKYPYRSRCGRSGSQGILRVGSKARAVVAQGTEKRHRSHHRVLNTTLVGDTHVYSQPHTQNHRVGSDMAKCINIPSDLFISNSILHGARNTPLSLGDTDLLVDSSAEPTSRCESTRAHSLTGLGRLTPVTECSEIGRATQMSESTPQTKITPHNKCNFKEPQTHLFSSQKSPQGDRMDLANPDQVPANLPNADYKAFTCPSRRLTQNQKPLRLAVITITKKSTPKRRSTPVVNSGGLTTPSENRPKAIPLKSIKQIKKSFHAPVTKARAKRREVNKSPNGSSWLSATKMGSTDDNALLGIARQVFDEARRTAAVHMNLKHVRLSVGQQKVESLDSLSERKTNEEPHAPSDHSSEPSLLKSSDQEAASVLQQTANSNSIPDYSQSVRLDANKNPLLKKRQGLHIQSTNMVRPLFSQISAQSASGISGPILKSNDPSSLELDLVDGAPYGLVQLHFLNRTITPKLST